MKGKGSQRRENISVERGNLVIHLQKEEHRGQHYTGGGVIGKRRFRYGYYEARVRMHGGAGWHQSVWAMFGGDATTTYPEQMHTEIDVIEFDSDVAWKGHSGLIVWTGPGKSRSLTCSPGAYCAPLSFDATAGFHTYGFAWTEQNIRFYLDGDLRCVLDYSSSDGEHDPVNFWLTAIAYPRLSGKIEDAKLPGRMPVDFAAFYRKEQP